LYRFPRRAAKVEQFVLELLEQLQGQEIPDFDDAISFEALAIFRRYMRRQPGSPPARQGTGGTDARRMQPQGVQPPRSQQGVINERFGACEDLRRPKRRE